MNILFVHSPSDLYGASKSLLRLSSALVKDGHNIYVVLQGKGPLVAKLKENNVSVFIDKSIALINRQRFSNIFDLLYTFILLPVSVVRFYYIIGQLDIDIVHSNTALILSPGIAARIRRIPHVWHIREFFTEFPIIWKVYQFYIYLFSNRIVCVSTSVAHQFIKKIRYLKVDVVHNGFPKDEFLRVSNDQVHYFKNRFNLNGKLNIGVIGRIKLVRKGQDIFLKAAAILKNIYPDVHFVIIGSPFPGNEIHFDRMMELIRELRLEKNVVYTGDVDDIQVAYQTLDVVVMPSGLPEPFGGVVIESMAHGKPVIGTNIGGTVEQIEDGISGILIHPNDPVALAKAMNNLIVNKKIRLKMGKMGKKRFLDLFEFDIFYQKINNIYYNLRE